MNNLLTAIMAKTSGSNLSTDVGGRIFLDQAPDGCEYPYIVFFIVSDAPDDVFAKTGENVIVQFSIYSSSLSASEISTIYTDLKSLFDGCSMSITGSNLIWFHRTELTTMVDEVTTPTGTQSVKHWAVDYEVNLQAT